MKREIVRPSHWQPSNLLSSAIKANGVVYCSGQLPLDPVTGTTLAGGIARQTRQVLNNLSEVLKAAGSDLSLALKVTICMTDLSGFAAMNEVYQEFFPRDAPARATVGVSALARADCQIEIDVVALEEH